MSWKKGMLLAQISCITHVPKEISTSVFAFVSVLKAFCWYKLDSCNYQRRRHNQAGGTVLTCHTPNVILQSFSLWFHPSPYLLALFFLPYLSFRCCSHSLSHRPTICPSPSLSLSTSFSSSTSPSLSDMWYLLASPAHFLHLSVPSAFTTSPLPLSIFISSTPCICSQHLWTHPSSPLTIFISSLSGSPAPLLPCIPICLYLLLSPSLSGLSSHKQRVQKKEWTWNGKLLISDSSATALSAPRFTKKKKKT